MELEYPKPWNDVLRFWFEDGLEQGWPSSNMSALWFRANRGTDAEIEERFGTFVEAALWSELVDWEGRARSRLALIILLDQFTRNIYRGTARAFAGDHRAQTLVQEGLALSMDEELPWVGRVFFYMPLMHAEDEDLQDRAVACYQRLHDAAPPEIAEKVKGNIKFAKEHQEIIQRFGRFPHRNRVLERESTEEELAFLENASSYGQ
jgi:uncharacterized protein (DUF924 family)